MDIALSSALLNVSLSVSTYQSTLPLFEDSISSLIPCYTTCSCQGVKLASVTTTKTTNKELQYQYNNLESRNTPFIHYNGDRKYSTEHMTYNKNIYATTSDLRTILPDATSRFTNSSSISSHSSDSLPKRCLLFSHWFKPDGAPIWLLR